MAADSVPAQERPGKATASIEDILGDPLVAKGKGFEIKRSRLDEALATYRSQMVEQGKEVPAAQFPEVEAELLDRLIETAIFNLQATDAQKAKAKEEADKRFENVKKYLVNDEGFRRRMRALGTTPEIFRQRVYEDSVRYTLLHERFHAPDEQLKKYYDEHPAEFMEPDQARVQHLLMLTVDLKLDRALSEEQRAIKRQKIEAILKRARAGEDFEKLAKETTEDPTAKVEGVEAKIMRGRSKIPREFEAAAFSLQTNQVSDVIASNLGFHLIKLLERTEGKKMALADATPILRNLLEEREIEKAETKVIVELKQKNSVEILDPEIKRIQDSLKTLSYSRDAITNSATSPAR